MQQLSELVFTCECNTGGYSSEYRQGVTTLTHNKPDSHNQGHRTLDVAKRISKQKLANTEQSKLVH